MPPKGQNKHSLDKQAWSWAETTDPNNISGEDLKAAYRLKLPKCTHTGQRRNCKGNPMCLIGMGEKEWLGEIADENWHDIEDPENERRKEGTFVGLKNLGATCYVNTLLQVWFHNPTFRNAIYEFREVPEPVLPPDDDEIDEEPKTICGQLQLNFALLEHSSRRYIDPSPFINCLGLNTMQQQDAQEFSKLFISLLEDTLSAQPNPRVKNIIQELFSGEYAYVTRCTNCHGISQHESKFYELDLNIKGHRDLSQCLEEFLEEEKLEGDNQYMCGSCNSKQNAQRSIQLTKLPPVLNLQLLRFVFDRNIGHKKKLNTCIQFPEELDMSKYMTVGTAKCVQSHWTKNTELYKYVLKAVLIHRGPTAYSGHYIAHIKDKKSNAWYKFNDEEIEKMKGSNLNLGNEEEIDVGADGVPKPMKKPRLSKGTHASKNAYMLVYQRKTDEHKDTTDPATPLIPVNVQEYVIKDNIKFEDWCHELVAMRDKNVASGKAKQEEIRRMYKMIQLTNESDLEWLSAEWITKWLSDSESMPPIDNSNFLCDHNKLNPDKVARVKCINKAGADVLYSKYNGGPRLTRDMMCMDCVHERCKVIRLKARVAEDSQLIGTALKKNYQPGGTCYWIGKMSLRSWKKFVFQQISLLSSQTYSLGTSTTSQPLGSPCAEIPGDNLPSLSRKSQDSISESGQSVPIFGSCTTGYSERPVNDHDKVMDQSNHSESALDSSCVQNSVQANLDGALNTEDANIDNCRNASENGDDDSKDEDFEFNEDILCKPHGNLCIERTERRLVSEDVWLRLRYYFPGAPEYQESADPCPDCMLQALKDAEAKEEHRILALEQKQSLPDLYYGKNRPKLKNCETEVYVVNNEFLESWRKFVRSPGRCEPPKEVMNSVLLCRHGLLTIHPETVDICDPVIVNTEGNSVTLLTSLEWEILQRYVIIDTPITVLPVNQDGCLHFLSNPEVCEECISCKMLDQGQVDYKYARIYIQKLSPGTNFSAPDKEVSSSANSSDKEERGDPEYAQSAGKKRKKEEPINTAAAKNDDPSLRRSSRHKKIRGEKEIRVDSTQTLRDLKLQIMKVYSVAPFDQHLMLGTKDLQDDRSTLADLGILPGSVLKLKVDEPMDSAYLMDDMATIAVAPEEGFKGTGLLSAR